MSVTTIEQARQRRHRRVRRKIIGTAERPRLCIFRSNRYVYSQLVDDMAGKTLVAACSSEPDLKGKELPSKTEAAKEVGRILASRAKQTGIEQVVFDRAGYLYHGRVKAVADGAREGGLLF